MIFAEFLARNVIWLADTNYRIDLENERVRYLAQMDDYDALFAADQVLHGVFDKVGDF